MQFHASTVNFKWIKVTRVGLLLTFPLIVTVNTTSVTFLTELHKTYWRDLPQNLLE